MSKLAAQWLKLTLSTKNDPCAAQSLSIGGSSSDLKKRVVTRA